MIPDDYYNYADERRVTITVSDEFFSNHPPSCVYSFTLSGDAVDGHDTIPKALLEYLYGKDEYSLDERRLITECGASGAVQEISLAVVSGIAGGLATYAVELLKKWKGSKDAEIPVSDDDLIDQLTRSIKRFYQPYGELTLLEQKPDGDDLTAVIRDSSDMMFHCSINRKTGFMKITRGERP